LAGRVLHAHSIPGHRREETTRAFQSESPQCLGCDSETLRMHLTYVHTRPSKWQSYRETPTHASWNELIRSSLARMAVPWLTPFKFSLALCFDTQVLELSCLSFERCFSRQSQHLTPPIRLTSELYLICLPTYLPTYLPNQCCDSATTRLPPLLR
jgi:hypothetical protein